MEDFTIDKIFTFIGFSVSYVNGQLFFGYKNCKPLGLLIQVNSQTPMSEDDIKFHLNISQRDYPDISLPVIFNLGGFLHNNGEYKDCSFLMDVNTITQILSENQKGIFDNVLLKIISAKGKPGKGTSLERWAEYKASLFFNNQLPLEQAVILSDAGIISKLSVGKDTWTEQLNAYLNHINYPGRAKKIPGNIKEWGRVQFDLYQKGQLSQYQIQQLVNNKIVWSGKYPLHKKYRELFDFIEEHKRLPFDYECKLYDFMQKELEGSHTQVYRLREIVLNFDTTSKGVWQQELEQIINEYNAVGKDISGVSSQSITWLNNQSLCDDNLSKYKKQKLITTLKWTCENYDYDWLQEYRKYAALTSPPGFRSEMWLWAIRQRVSCLEKYKRNALKKINFDFKGITHRWYECFECFCSLDSQSRETVSSIKKDNIYWAYLNRKTYAEGNLEKEKIKLLEEAGFDFKEEEFKWILMYERLKDLYDITKDAQCSKLDEELRQWCVEQRQIIAEINLTIPQAQKLNTIGFVVSDPDFEEFIIKINQLVNQDERKRLPLDYKSYPWIAENPFRLAHAGELEFYLSPERAKLGDQSMAYYDLLIQFWKNETCRWKLYVSKIQDCADYLRDVRQKGILDAEIISQLNAAGFRWEEPKIEEWLFMLSKCQRFIHLYNHVPRHESKDCKIWRFTQLSLYKAGKLSEFKKNAFESVRIYTPAK